MFDANDKALAILRERAPSMAITYQACEPDDEYYGETGEGEFIFTNEWLVLDDDGKLFVALHELSHYLTQDARHGTKFYDRLTELVKQYRVPWPVAVKLEQIVPTQWLVSAGLK